MRHGCRKMRFGGKSGGKMRYGGKKMRYGGRKMRYCGRKMRVGRGWRSYFST